MNDYNKKNLFFLLGIFALLAVVFTTVVTWCYLPAKGLWAFIIPTAFIGVGLVKAFIKLNQYKDM